MENKGIYKLIPKLGTVYKYRLKEILEQIRVESAEIERQAVELILRSCRVSRMTLYRWKNIKHESQEGRIKDIPFSALFTVMRIFKDIGSKILHIEDLLNFTVERTEYKSSDESEEP